jgi:proteic killer suppression protein
MIFDVRLSRMVNKQLRKLPQHITVNLMSWVDDVERNGLEVARKRLGYHDEPLHGQLKGQRSVRLSRSYRAIYEIKDDNSVEFVNIEEVSKHEY